MLLIYLGDPESNFAFTKMVVAQPRPWMSVIRLSVSLIRAASVAEGGPVYVAAAPAAVYCCVDPSDAAAVGWSLAGRIYGCRRNHVGAAVLPRDALRLDVPAARRPIGAEVALADLPLPGHQLHDLNVLLKGLWVPRQLDHPHPHGMLQSIVFKTCSSPPSTMKVTPAR